MGVLSWVSLALVGYVAVSLLWHLNLSLLGKGILLLIFIVISQKFAVFAALGGEMFNPAMSRTALLIWESLYNILLVLVPLLIIKDVGYWVTKGVGMLAGKHFVWPLSLDWVKWGLLLFSIAGGIYGTYAALKVPDVHRVEVRLQNLDPAFDGYRIVQMADLHVGQLIRRPWLEVVVNKANALKPDLILLTGDMVEGRASSLAQEVKPYARLRADDGVFAVTGNHEYWHGHKAWIEYFEGIGIEMLENRHFVVSRGNAHLVIAGRKRRSLAPQKAP